MKLMWTLCLTWSLFYAADALQCTTCMNFADPLCTNTSSVECATDQLCLSATLQGSVTGFGSLAVNVVTKSCVPAAICAVLGNAAFSTNLGFAEGAASSLCCNTTDCNSATLSVSTQQGNNELTCFTCDSLTDENCNNKTVQCVGSEDRCVNGSVRTGDSTINTFGCASASLCTAISQLATIPLVSSIANFTDGPTCCEGDCCNSASILSLSILPLLMAPLTFTLTF